MILIAYDGSADANEAIKRAGELMKGKAAAVLTVWEPFESIAGRVGSGIPIGSVDYAELDRSYGEHARQRAEAGASLARDAGLKARALVRLRFGSVSHDVLQHADLPVIVVPSPDVAAARAART
jgi:nucleotide-binding universal stress UspA family protein